MPNSNLFQNRSGTNLNRRKLTIISQSANEMIVDMERADNVQTGNEGTTLNADVMNALDDRITAAENNSSTALSTANAANTKALYVESQLADRGATIKFNGVTQTEVNFLSDPQTQIDTKTNVKVNNAHVNEVSFSSDPQTQITNLSSSVNTLVTQMSNTLSAPLYSTAVNITTSTSFTYTPTKNGFIWVKAAANMSDASYFRVKRSIDAGSEQYNGIIGENLPNRWGHHLSMVCPVKSGDTYYIYINSTNDYTVYFVEGANG